MTERPSFQPISNSGHLNDMLYYGAFFGGLMLFTVSKSRHSRLSLHQNLRVSDYLSWKSPWNNSFFPIANNLSLLGSTRSVSSSNCSIICQFHQHWILVVASNSSFHLLMHPVSSQVNAQLTLNASAFSVPINSHADVTLIYLGFDPLYFLAISRRSSDLALIPKWSVWVVHSIFSSGCKLSKWDKYHHIAKTTR